MSGERLFWAGAAGLLISLTVIEHTLEKILKALQRIAVLLAEAKKAGK